MSEKLLKHNGAFVELDGVKVGYGYETFIIAEGGNNHQGDPEHARLLVDLAKKGRAQCVKFQMRTPAEAMTKHMMDQPYNSIHSFGRTYGEHRQKVELPINEWKPLKEYAKQSGLLFTASPWDTTSCKFLLEELNLGFIKVASGDLKNFFLLEMIARSKRVPIISTGMSDLKQVKESVKRFQMCGSTPTPVLLQCTSLYPCLHHKLNISVVQTFHKEFPNCVIGYSGHESDLFPTALAVGYGADVVERHFTRDRKFKGNDQAASLLLEDLLELKEQCKVMSHLVTHEELYESMHHLYPDDKMKTLYPDSASLCEKIKVVSGNGEKVLQDGELNEYKKLGKSLVVKQSLRKGDVLKIEHLTAKSPGTGVLPSNIDRVIGSTLLCDVEQDTTLMEHMFKYVESSSVNNVTNNNFVNDSHQHKQRSGSICNLSEEDQFHPYKCVEASA